LEYWDRGLKVKQIAAVLRVSERSVERDLVAVRHIIAGRQSRELQEVADAIWREYLGRLKV